MAWLTNPKRLTLLISAGALGIITWYLVHCYLNYEPSVDDEEEDEESLETLEDGDFNLNGGNKNSNAEKYSDRKEFGLYNTVDEILSKERANTLLQLLENEDMEAEVLTYAANCAAFHESQVNLLAVGFADRAMKMVKCNSPEVRRKALMLLNNLCQNPAIVEFENFVTTLFECVTHTPFEDVVVAENALKVLTNLSVTDAYHDDFVRYVPVLFDLITVRDGCHVIVLHCWKILVNLSTNLDVLRHILDVNFTPSLVNIDSEILLRIVTFLSNAAEGIVKLNLSASNNPAKLLDYVIYSGELRRILKNEVAPYVDDEEILRVINKLISNLDEISMMKRRQIQDDVVSRSASSLTNSAHVEFPGANIYKENMQISSADAVSSAISNHNETSAAGYGQGSDHEPNLPDQHSIENVSEIATSAIQHALNESLECCNKYSDETGDEFNRNARSYDSNSPTVQISDSFLQSNQPATENKNDLSEHLSVSDNNSSLTFETAEENSEIKDSPYGNGKHDDLNDQKDAVEDTMNDIMADPIFAFDNSKDTLNATFTSDGDMSRPDADLTLLKNVGNDTLPDKLSDDVQNNRSPEEELNDDSETLSQNSNTDNLSNVSESSSLPSQSSSYSIDSFMSANSFH